MDEKEKEQVVSALVKRLGTDDTDLVSDIYDDALAQVLDYTNRTKLVGNMAIYVKQLAIVMFNRQGNEGESISILRRVRSRLAVARWALSRMRRSIVCCISTAYRSFLFMRRRLGRHHDGSALSLARRARSPLSARDAPQPAAVERSVHARREIRA